MHTHTADSKYDIRISAAQRHYLLVALAQCRMQGYHGADEEGRQEIDDLHGMLDSDSVLEPLADPSGVNAAANVLNDFTA